MKRKVKKENHARVERALRKKHDRKINTKVIKNVVRVARREVGEEKWKYMDTEIAKTPRAADRDTESWMEGEECEEKYVLWKCISGV